MLDDVSRRRYLRLAGGSLPAISGLAGCLGGELNQQPIRVGALLPLSASGALGTVAKHHRRAIEAAVADINDAGGPLDRKLDLTAGDSELDQSAAKTAFDSFVDNDVVGFVGPVTTDISRSLADDLARKRVIAISPSSTYPDLATAAVRDGTKYFDRTAANDVQQARVMAKILDDDRYVAADTVAIAHADNDFGTGLATAIDERISGETVATVPFTPGKDDYSKRVETVVQSDADAVAFVSEPGNTAMLEQLISYPYYGESVLSEGLIPENIPLYMNNMYSASVATERTSSSIELSQKLEDITPLAPYTQHAYDAAFLLGLAIEQAGEADATAISDSLVSVSGGVGQTVTVGEFERAKKIISAGRAVNYRGASGPVDLNDDLEPLDSYVIERVTDFELDELELLRAWVFEEESTE